METAEDTRKNSIGYVMYWGGAAILDSHTGGCKTALDAMDSAMERSKR